MASVSEISETIDFIFVMSIGYHLHQGRPRMMKKIARGLKKKYKNGRPKNYCDKIIDEPDGTFFLVNTISHGHFSRYAIKDSTKSMVI